jgi:hypothetical protein
MLRAKTGGKLLELVITVDDTELRLKFGRFAGRLADLRSFWLEYFAPQFFADIQRNFKTQGRPVGGWRPLSARYARWKLANYGRLPILQLRRYMVESFRMGGRGSYLRVAKRSAEMGSRDRKVRFHQYGTDRMPARPPIWIAGKRVYQPLLNRWLREEAIETGLIARRA